MSDHAEFRTLDIKLEIEINKPPEVVWQSLTAGISEWWPKAFYVGTSPKRFAIEPEVGGRVFEDWGDGEGGLFGVVTVFEANRMLQWAGDMSADFGGPARSVTTFRLSPTRHGKSTTLAFRDTPYGLLSDGAVQGLQEGWSFLLNACFKPFLEEGKRPERPATLEG
jgi:uncharacterized protein YndB with AHSA1/START domain